MILYLPHLENNSWNNSYFTEVSEAFASISDRVHTYTRENGAQSTQLRRVCPASSHRAMMSDYLAGTSFTGSLSWISGGRDEGVPSHFMVR